MDHLATELKNAKSNDLDLLSSKEFVLLMCGEDAQIPDIIADHADVIASVIDAIVLRMRKGGRLIYCGAGTSGRLGVLDASECPPTFSVPSGLVIGLIAGGEKALTTAVEGAEDNPDLGRNDLQNLALNSNDCVVGIATSGRTPYVLGALQFAKMSGAFTVAFSCTPDAEINQHADTVLSVVVGPEIITGSTRLKAGTATKLVLNMISTGVMVALGKTFGNLMVDLKASNVKLKARANRILRDATGLAEQEAQTLLLDCSGELKTAIIAHELKVEPDIARARLLENQGVVRRTISNKTPALEIDANLILGVDGGGTKTVAVLARRGKKDFSILGRGVSQASNPRVVGFSNASRAIHDAVKLAFKDAGIPFTKVGFLAAGISGAGRDEEKNALQIALASLAGKVIISTDASLVLEEGLMEGWGIAVISGTGSIVLGKNQQGESFRAGGWGSVLGDEGSGYALGMGALKLLTHFADGREKQSPLQDKILAHLGIVHATEIVALLHEDKLDKSMIANLAIEVLHAHGLGDMYASSLINDQAGQLASCVGAVHKQMNLKDEMVPLTLAGSLICQSDVFRQAFLEHLQILDIKVGLLTLVHEPALGALRMALS